MDLIDLLKSGQILIWIEGTLLSVYRLKHKDQFLIYFGFIFQQITINAWFVEMIKKIHGRTEQTLPEYLIFLYFFAEFCVKMGHLS